jgi:hypothetical protein
MSRPMKKQAAAKLPALAGLATCHTASLGKAEVGAGRLTRPVCSRRMLGSAAAATSYSPPMTRRTGSSMFDWPEHSHTSPISRSVRVWVSAPERTVRLSGAPGSRAGSAADQRPWASAVALAFAPERSMATAALGWATPQTRIGWPRCRTAWSPKTGASKGAAEAAVARAAKAAESSRRFIEASSPHLRSSRRRPGPRLSLSGRWVSSGSRLSPGRADFRGVSPGRPRRPGRWSVSRPAG